MPSRPSSSAPQSLVRTALRPRMLALLALALGLAVVFAELGAWQLGRARTSEQPPAERGAVPIGDVLAPQEQLTAEAVAGPVSVDGTWADVPLQRVVDRGADGEPGEGSWVLGALQVDGAALDGGAGSSGGAGSGGGAGALLPVALGYLPEGQAPPAAPTGGDSLVGELVLSEDPRGTTALPAGELATASSADLLNVWGGPIYAAYLVPEAAVAGLAPLPPPEREAETNLQNVSYAFQWWVFAGFAVLMWLRIVRDVRLRDVERAEDEAQERRLAAGQHGEGDDASAGPGSTTRPSTGPDPSTTRRPQEASR
ncbi:SURF1 family protein [Pseudokineococcus sp. 1T1Z-3]|uniref:SURF1 family protein n=1 Tax=Pseudokineococcus sp. 1T1Z-3 TaxID=3132745 RepID=UPI0030980D2F